MNIYLFHNGEGIFGKTEFPSKDQRSVSKMVLSSKPNWMFSLFSLKNLMIVMKGRSLHCLPWKKVPYLTWNILWGLLFTPGWEETMGISGRISLFMEWIKRNDCPSFSLCNEACRVIQVLISIQPGEISQYLTIFGKKGVGEQIRDLYNLSGPPLQQRWAKKNIPALHEEPDSWQRWTITIPRVSFQLNYFQWSEQFGESGNKMDHLEGSAAKTLLERGWFRIVFLPGIIFGWTDEVKKVLSGDAILMNTEKYMLSTAMSRDNFNTVFRKRVIVRMGCMFLSPLKDVFKE